MKRLHCFLVIVFLLLSTSAFAILGDDIPFPFYDPDHGICMNILGDLSINLKGSIVPVNSSGNGCDEYGKCGRRESAKYALILNADDNKTFYFCPYPSRIAIKDNFFNRRLIERALQINACQFHALMFGKLLKEAYWDEGRPYYQEVMIRYFMVLSEQDCAQGPGIEDIQ